MYVFCSDYHNQVNTPITSHGYLFWGWESLRPHPLTDVEYICIVPSVVTMLCSSTWDVIRLTSESLCPLTDISHLPHASLAGNHHFTLWFYEFNIVFRKGDCGYGREVLLKLFRTLYLAKYVYKLDGTDIFTEDNYINIKWLTYELPRKIFNLWSKPSNVILKAI